MTKKILIVVPSLGIGGREKIALNMRECLKDLFEIKIVIFQTKEKEYPIDDEVINMHIPATDNKFKRFFGQIRRAKKLKKIIKKETPDFVFSLGATANLTNILAKSRNAVKHIVVIHSFAEVKKSRRNSFIFKKADTVVAISQEMHHRLLQLYPELSNTAVIENGYKIVENIDVNNHIFNAKKPNFVSMGRLERVKGFDRLIKAFSHIVKSVPTAQLSIIGDGSEKENLINLTKTLGLTDNVKFLGYHADPLPLLALNDIYLLTSRNEGFPNCLIEALNCGLAVVAVDCLSGPREILSAKYDVKPIEGICFEKYGVLVENNDNEDKLVEKFAQAAIELVNSEHRLSDYKKAGKTRAKDFSLEVFSEKLKDLFEKNDVEIK